MTEPGKVPDANDSSWPVSQNDSLVGSVNRSAVVFGPGEPSLVESAADRTGVRGSVSGVPHWLDACSALDWLVALCMHGDAALL